MTAVVRNVGSGPARRLVGLLILAVICHGCAQQDRGTAYPLRPARVLVVAPVLNLSGSEDFDPLKITDLVASELVALPNVTVIPVSRTLGELARRGKLTVETPDEAVELAQAFDADATLVTAVTEYNPYHPPVVGLIMQLYEAAAPQRGVRLDPVVASRRASSPEEALLVADVSAPQWQVQRVFDASDEALLKDIRAFAKERDGHASPYGWRKYVQSQELYVRYCSHALILPLIQLDETRRVAAGPSEAGS